MTELVMSINQERTNKTMRLYHEEDVALELVDERSELEKAMSVNDEFHIPSSSVGIIKKMGDKAFKELLVPEGTKVHFDPRMMVEIKSLNIAVVNFRAVIMEAQ